MDQTGWAIVLLLTAFLPSLAYLFWMRTASRHRSEPRRVILGCFVFGAIMAVLIALALEMAASELLASNWFLTGYLFQGSADPLALTMAILVAPVAEETAKLIGVRWAKHHITRVQSGLILGMACGLGFAATENLLYEGMALSRGLIPFITVAVMRSLASALLHGSATALSGYGYARHRLGVGHWLPWLLLAMMMHGAFNAMVSLEALYGDVMDYAGLIGLLSAILMTMIAVVAVRRGLH